MPRGIPDYYNPDTIVSQRLANVEEVVAAVLKFSRIDNRGRTLFFETFDENLSGWRSVSGGDGSAPAISTTRAYIPPSSAYLDAGTSGGSGTSRLDRFTHLGASALLGCELAVWYDENAPEYHIELNYIPVGTMLSAQLSILPASGVVRIYTGSAYVTVGDVGYAAPSTGLWLPLKLVADYTNNLYVRALVGQVQIDLSAYALEETAVVMPGEARIHLSAKAANAMNNDGYLGYVAFTVDEP